MRLTVKKVVWVDVHMDKPYPQQRHEMEMLRLRRLEPV